MWAMRFIYSLKEGKEGEKARKEERLNPLVQKQNILQW